MRLALKALRSKHRGQHAIGRAMPVHEGSDVDDDLLAHVDAAFQGGRAHVGQQHDLSHARELHELRIDCGLMLEHVEAGTGDLSRGDHPHQRILVDNLAACRVDNIGLRPDVLEAAG